MLTHPGCVDVLRKFRSILCAGAPTDSALGDEIASLNPRFQTAYAASELGTPPLLLAEGGGRQWEYVKIMDCGQIYEEARPGVFELVIPKTEQTIRHWACFDVFPDIKEYRTQGSVRTSARGAKFVAVRRPQR